MSEGCLHARQDAVHLESINSPTVTPTDRLKMSCIFDRYVIDSDLLQSPLAQTSPCSYKNIRYNYHRKKYNEINHWPAAAVVVN